LREEATDTVKIYQVCVRRYFDQGRKHTVLKEGDKVYLRLAKNTEHGYQVQNQTQTVVRQYGTVQDPGGYIRYSVQDRITGVVDNTEYIP
jgi:hypothetical protein